MVLHQDFERVEPFYNIYIYCPFNEWQEIFFWLSRDKSYNHEQFLPGLFFSVKDTLLIPVKLHCKFVVQFLHIFWDLDLCNAISILKVKIISSYETGFRALCLCIIQLALLIVIYCFSFGNTHYINGQTSWKVDGV